MKVPSNFDISPSFMTHPFWICMDTGSFSLFSAPWCLFLVPIWQPNKYCLSSTVSSRNYDSAPQSVSITFSVRSFYCRLFDFRACLNLVSDYYFHGFFVLSFGCTAVDLLFRFHHNARFASVLFSRCLSYFWNDIHFVRETGGRTWFGKASGRQSALLSALFLGVFSCFYYS